MSIPGPGNTPRALADAYRAAESIEALALAPGVIMLRGTALVMVARAVGAALDQAAKVDGLTRRRGFSISGGCWHGKRGQSWPGGGARTSEQVPIREHRQR